MERNEILKQLDKIEALKVAYETTLEVEDANSSKAISAFRKWYLTVVELFEELFGEEDQLLQKFQAENVSGNGYSLEYVYPTLQVLYTKLKVKAKKFGEQNGVKEIAVQGVKMKTKKIFISHSHDDGEFATALVELLHDIGFEYEEIFCSSVPACSIPEGKSIFDEIRAQFDKHDLFVIFIHSPRLYASHISMNEMGAAWVLRTDYSSFLTKDMTTDLMKKAVVQDDRIYVKIGDKQAHYRLNEWQERILKFFGKPAVKMNAWMQDSAKFLEKVTNLSYPEVQPEKSEVSQLSKEDEEILKKWVDSEDDTMYYGEFLGGNAFVVLGNVQYTINSAREKSEWRAFFNRLLSAKMVEQVGTEGLNPLYRLTVSAYTYFE